MKLEALKLRRRKIEKKIKTRNRSESNIQISMTKKEELNRIYEDEKHNFQNASDDKTERIRLPKLKKKKAKNGKVLSLEEWMAQIEYPESLVLRQYSILNKSQRRKAKRKLVLSNQNSVQN